MHRRSCLPANSSGAQHRGDARRDKIDVYTGALRSLYEGFAHKAFDLVLGNGENLGVNRIVMLDRQHGAMWHRIVGGTRAVVSQIFGRRRRGALQNLKIAHST